MKKSKKIILTLGVALGVASLVTPLIALSAGDPAGTPPPPVPGPVPKPTIPIPPQPAESGIPLPPSGGSSVPEVPPRLPLPPEPPRPGREPEKPVPPGSAEPGSAGKSENVDFTNANATFTYKPDLVGGKKQDQVLPNEYNVGNNVIDSLTPPDGMNIVEPVSSVPNKIDGTLKITYKLAKGNKESEEKNITVRGFETQADRDADTQNSFDEKVNGVKVAFREGFDKENTLPSEVKDNDFVISNNEGLNITNKVIKPNDDNGSLVYEITFSDGQNNTKVEDYPFNELETINKRNKTIVDNEEAKFIYNSSLIGNKDQNQVLPSEYEKFTNKSLFTTLNNEIVSNGTVIYIHKIVPNDDEGKLVITYTLSKDGQTSDEKTLSVNDFETISGREAAKTQAEKKKALKDEIANANKIENTLSNDDIKSELQQAIETAEAKDNDSTTSTEDLNNATQALENAVNQAKQKQATLNSLFDGSATYSYDATLNDSKEQNTVLASEYENKLNTLGSDYSKYVATNITPEGAQATVTNVGANDDEGKLVITYTLSKDGQTSSPKTAEISGFETTREKTQKAEAKAALEAANVTFTYNASLVGNKNQDQVLPAEYNIKDNVKNSLKVPEGMTIKDIMVTSNDINGTLEIKYTLSKDGQVSELKTINVEDFQTIKDLRQKSDSLNNNVSDIPKYLSDHWFIYRYLSNNLNENIKQELKSISNEETIKELIKEFDTLNLDYKKLIELYVKRDVVEEEFGYIFSMKSKKQAYIDAINNAASLLNEKPLGNNNSNVKLNDIEELNKWDSDVKKSIANITNTYNDLTSRPFVILVISLSILSIALLMVIAYSLTKKKEKNKKITE